MTLCLLDTETTGLETTEGHRPWEIAAIIRDDDAETEHVWQIRPDLTVADPVAQEKNRFAERFLLPDGWEAAICDVAGDAVIMEMKLHRATRWAVADDIRQVLHGATLVAANPGFDIDMLKALLRDNGLRPSWHYRPTCVESLVQAVHRLPKPPGLKDAADAMGVKYDPDELHSALGDARLAKAVYDAVMTRGAR